MEPGCAAKAWRTGVVLVYAVISIHLIWLIISAIPSTTLSSILSDLRSGWVREALMDYFAGALFAAIYIHSLRGRSFLSLPYPLIAFLTPVVGSPLALLYVCAVLSHSPSLRALVPGVCDERGAAKRPRVVGALFACYLAVFFAVSVHAAASQGWSDAMAAFRDSRFARAVAHDVFGTLALVAVVIVVRERGFSRAAILWLIGLFFAGNGATCVYVMLVARRAVRERSSFRAALLTPVDAPRPAEETCPAEEPAPGNARAEYGTI